MTWGNCMKAQFKNRIFKFYWLKQNKYILPIAGLMLMDLIFATSMAAYIMITRPDVNLMPWKLSRPWERIMDTRRPRILKLFTIKQKYPPREDLYDYYKEMEDKEKKLCEQFGPLPKKACPPGN